MDFQRYEKLTTAALYAFAVGVGIILLSVVVFCVSHAWAAFKGAFL
jgi:hypothetical protein